MPEVYCSLDTLKTTMNEWLVAMETAVCSNDNVIMNVSI